MVQRLRHRSATSIRSRTRIDRACECGTQACDKGWRHRRRDERYVAHCCIASLARLRAAASQCKRGKRERKCKCTCECEEPTLVDGKFSRKRRGRTQTVDVADWLRKPDPWSTGCD